MKNLIFTVVFLLVSFKAFSTPFLGNGGFITPQGKNDVKINLFYNEYKGSYDGNGLYTAFPVGVGRNDYTMLFDLKYGPSRDNDLQIILPYENKTHTLANGSVFSCSGLGDLIVVGRSLASENKSKGSMVVMGMGVKVPTGRSIFHLESGSLATGTGTWDVGGTLSMQESMSGLLVYTDLAWWYRFGFNSETFNGRTISSIKAPESFVKFNPGTLLKYNIGAEMPVMQMVSLIGELSGTVYYENKVEYGSGADAMADLIAVGGPDFTIERSVNARVLAGGKVYFNERVTLGGGVSIPVSIVNGFGNMTYIVHARLMF